MRVGALRAEFLLTGFAFLGALTGFLEAVGVPAVEWVVGDDLATLSVGAFGLLAAAAYVVGIAIVQLTFFFPTNGMIVAVRNSRFRDLTRLDTTFRTEAAPPTANRHPDILALAFSGQSGWTAYRVPWGLRGPVRRLKRSTRLATQARVTTLLNLLDTRGEEMEPAEEHDAGRSEPPTDHAPMPVGPKDRRALPSDELRHAQTLALTIGRGLAPPEVAEEYKYRRANRQVFVGMLPSALLGGAAATVALGRTSGTWIVAMPIITFLVIWALVSSAAYQERISQSMIIDVAFLRRWNVPLDGESSVQAQPGD